MLHKLFACLTILLVVSCPLLCHAGYCPCCCASKAAATSTGHKSCCPRSDSDESASRPYDDDGKDFPGDNGQHCFCKGAPLDHVSLDVDALASLVLPFTDVPPSVTAVAVNDAAFVELIEDDTPSGLCARIALCSLVH